MSSPIAHLLASAADEVTCSRCLDTIAVAAGRWHAIEPDDPRAPVCDSCARRDDPPGYAGVLAWRRAAAGPATGRWTA